MAEKDEVALNWGDELNVVPGQYIWLIHISSAAFKDTDKEKPYAQLECVVIEGPETGYKFNFRLYITKAARNWATYFLKKFGYPEESLASDPPRLVRKQLEGLEGKILVDLTEAQQGFGYGLRVDAKGFDHVDGKELEKKVSAEGSQASPVDEPAIDVHADVAPAQPQGTDFLDNLDKL